MESWERELRERLERELPNGVAFEISVPWGDKQAVILTGKGGYIDYRVSLEEYIRYWNIKIEEKENKE